jgi:acylphosphatase
MRKGIKISISGKVNHDVFDNFILNRATELGISGSLQIFDNNKLIVYAVGDTENVESLIDDIYGDSSGATLDEIDVKPIDEEKNFRGIFRIIK